MGKYDDYWTVEYRHGIWDWTSDNTGPHALYDTRDQALAWAVKLRQLHRNVRLKRTVHTYENVEA